MSENISINSKSTALLLMDFQNVIVDNFAGNKATLLANTNRLLKAARQASLFVIYVVVDFRPGFPEISPRNKQFGGVRESGMFTPGAKNTEIHPDLAPIAGDVVVTKHRVNAFAGTDLDQILRAHSIDTLILSGIATSGVVLSTTRHAADADYSLIIARDCCADMDEEVHRVLLDKVLPKQAEVFSVDQILPIIEGRVPAAK
jgi:nicotinamidase-related amidase